MDLEANRIDLSIIVPVYNTASYLERCLDSLVKQTLQQVEIIIVNDGSTDNSQAIINKYKNLYPSKIISFYKQNGGLSSARNYGVKYARGKYLSFVDSDDWVDLNLFEVVFNDAGNHDADIACFDYWEYYPDQVKKVYSFQSIYGKKHYFNKYLIPVIACNKLFKKTFWDENKFIFYDGIKYEDSELIPQIISKTENIIFVKEVYYHYDRSIANTITKLRRDITSINIILEKYISFYEKHSNNKLFQDFLVNWIIYTIYLGVDDLNYIFKINKKYHNFIKYEYISNKKIKALFFLDYICRGILFKPIIYFSNWFIGYRKKSK